MSTHASRIRLDKYLAHATAQSRSQVRALIKKGAVLVNGEVVKQADFHVPANAEVSLEGTILGFPGKRYFMLNKPAGVVCATEDGDSTTVIDLLHETNINNLHCAGRLDKDTTGLVLISDDGQWTHRITSPNQDCFKRYRVELSEPIGDHYAEAFATGIQLKNEPQPTRPARLQVLDEYSALVWLSEGRYHQVKRMFAAQGNHVTALHREAIGNIELDSELAPGQYRVLEGDEINAPDSDEAL